jgi:Tfp pilus assembly protein PilF
MCRFKRPCQDRFSVVADFIVVFLAWLYLTSSCYAADCVLQRAAELPIVDNSQLSPIVMIPIDDQPRRVLLDTGGFWNIINDGIISDQKAAPAERLSYVGLYGRPLEDYYRIQSVKVGPINFKNVDFYALAGYLGSLDATLGGDYLRAFDIEIDPVKGSVSFFLKNSCGDKVVYWPHDDISEIPLNIDLPNKHINITAIVNGKAISGILDTGSSVSYLDLTTARRMFGVDENTPGMQLVNSKANKKDDRLEIFRYRFQTLTLGDFTFKNPTIHLAHMTGYGPRFILGMQELHGLHLFFAYGQEKLYMTTSRGDIAAMQASKPGTGEFKSVHPDPLEQLNARTYMQAAANDFEADDFDEAMKAADEALRLDPTLGFAHLTIAGINLKRGNTAIGLDEAKNATRDHPGDVELYIRRMKLYVDNGLFDAAFADAETLRQLQPKSPEALNRSCWFGALAGKTELALGYCNTALAMRPKVAPVLDSRAFAHFKAGQWDLALDDFNAALKLNPHEAHSLYGRGLVEKQKGNESDASGDIAAAIRLNPEIAETFEKF